MEQSGHCAAASITLLGSSLCGCKKAEDAAALSSPPPSVMSGQPCRRANATLDCTAFVRKNWPCVSGQRGAAVTSSMRGVEVVEPTAEEWWMCESKRCVTKYNICAAKPRDRGDDWQQ